MSSLELPNSPKTPKNQETLGAPDGYMPTAAWLRLMQPVWARATAAGAAAVRAMPLPADLSRRGAAIEWPLAEAVSAAVWNDIPAWVRESFDGVVGDHGADALGLGPDGGLVLWQFKWYAPGRAAGYAARAQLESIARDAALRLGTRVSAAFGLRAGMRPCSFTSHAALECFRRAIPIIRYFDYADLGLNAEPDAGGQPGADGQLGADDQLDEDDRREVAKVRPAVAAAVSATIVAAVAAAAAAAAADSISSAAVADGLAAAMSAMSLSDIAPAEDAPAEDAPAEDAPAEKMWVDQPVDPRAVFQQEAIAAANQKLDSGAMSAFVVMATGTGKSRVAAGVAFGRTVAGGPPALIVAPRLEILGGLAGAFAPGEWAVHRVGAGRPWPSAAALADGDRRHAIIASAQSLDGHMPPGAEFSLVIRDEAHNGTGLAALAAHAGAARAPQLLLTATPDGNGLPAGTPPPVFQLLFPQAALLALVCDPVFMFVGFEFAPTPATLAADLLVRPFHSILVVYNSQASALALWTALEERAPGVAGLLTSDYEPVKKSLHRFRSGALRILVSVDKVGMGVDVPRCDAVVVAEPRGSPVDLAQLFGRACRLCPETKPERKFAVVLPRSVEALADADASAAELAGALRIVFDGVPPAGAIQVVPAGGYHSDSRTHETGTAFEKIAELIFDSSARAVEPRAAQLRREYARCRAMIAANAESVPGRRSPTAAWLARLRQARPEKFGEFPDDPAGYFAELFTTGGFPWSEFTGAAEPTVDEYLAFLGGLVRDDPAGAAAQLATNPDGVIASARGFGIPPGRDPRADMSAMLGKK
jgi:hypothetical protein